MKSLIPRCGQVMSIRSQTKSRGLLASDDWYRDLEDEDANIVDEFVYAMLDEDVERKLGIGFECSDYESIYWDCAEIAAAQGAAMMQEPTFGSSGFRYSGELARDFGYCRNYSIFTPEQAVELYDQLQNVESHFDSLPDDGEDGFRAQFFQGLLGPVKYAAQNNRYLFVQTDT